MKLSLLLKQCYTTTYNRMSTLQPTRTVYILVPPLPTCLVRSVLSFKLHNIPSTVHQGLLLLRIPYCITWPSCSIYIYFLYRIHFSSIDVIFKKHHKIQPSWHSNSFYIFRYFFPLVGINQYIRFKTHCNYSKRWEEGLQKATIINCKQSKML